MRAMSPDSEHFFFAMDEEHFFIADMANQFSAVDKLSERHTQRQIGTARSSLLFSHFRLHR